jgi:ribosomal protein S18 acetylase RimI-like enzyme
MDIELGPQRIIALDEREGADSLRQRAMDKRSNAFTSGLGSLLQRPKGEDIELTASQRRLDPFWHVVGKATYVYERRREYAVPASGGEVGEVTIEGSTYAVADSGPGARTFRLDALEHCREELNRELNADARSGAVIADAAAVLAGPQHEVADPTLLATDDTLVVSPEHRASFVVRQLLAELLKPVQADRILEESIVLETTDLVYRPVWAFEFLWRPKDKRGVVEIDAATGAVTAGGSILPHIGKVITRDALFDIGADTVGLLVPGGSIAVKVARAALDKSY